MPTIRFVNEKKEIQVPVGANLRNEAIRAGVQVYQGMDKVFHCPGLGCCGTCRVLVPKGMENLSPIGFREGLRLKVSMDYIGHENEMRLACQTLVNGDVDVVTQPAVNWFGENFFS
ncbi:MAG TPA: 2Fe-2S iron-sulfur cluster-binding protein [Pirellulales bacterium]|jgi:2Fe-2S ferredoxin|nr:2Fe-2S iron-sulfur cluster-binding protein [Pirellulales bacterium]